MVKALDILALWDLLYFAKEIEIPRLHVFGDSSMVINWEKDIASLSILDLEAWCEDIKKLSSSFSSVDYKHVYRDYNEKAYLLSKEGLLLATCHLSFMEYHEDLVIGSDDMLSF